MPRRARFTVPDGIYHLIVKKSTPISKSVKSHFAFGHSLYSLSGRGLPIFFVLRIPGNICDAARRNS